MPRDGWIDPGRGGLGDELVDTFLESEPFDRCDLVFEDLEHVHGRRVAPGKPILYLTLPDAQHIG